MGWTLALSIIAIAGMLGFLAFKPEIKLGRFSLSTFWIVPFLVALILVFSPLLGWGDYAAFLTEKSAINPLEILVLFFSMSFLSTVLDEAGFFSYVAAKAVGLAKGSQFVVFLLLYFLTSALTIFTSNDIIILTFTPFLIYFSKNAKVDPIPYLVGEFVAANSWSLLFLIGNPTNIYLGQSFGISFVPYFLAMWPSTIFGGVASFLVMLLLFHKKLAKPFQAESLEVKIKTPYLLWTSLSCLVLCLVMMVLSNVIEVPLWAIAGIAAASELLFCLIFMAFRHDRIPYVLSSIRRLPYPVIPFILSMAAIVLSLKKAGWTGEIGTLLAGGDPIWTYGFASFFGSNLINNIPMSVLFTEIIKDGGAGLTAVYASIIGSNLGAFLTPVGALAGVMWMSILKEHQIHFTFFDFVKYGAIIAIPSLLAALAGLYL